MVTLLNPSLPGRFGGHEVQNRLKPPIGLMSDLHRHAAEISLRTQKQLKACSLFGSLIEVLKSCQNEVMVGPNIFMRLVPQGKPYSFAGYPCRSRKARPSRSRNFPRPD